MSVVDDRPFYGFNQGVRTQHLHILGVCGTAMAAIASLAKSQGWHVTGSDAAVYPPMSDYLHDLGVAIAPYDEANLNPAPDLCVIGNALSRGNAEVEAILNRGLRYCSGPEFVGNHLLPGRHAVVVAGTHGKTTTASLLAYVLDQAKKQPGFLIGGIPENFSGGARLGEGAPFILEGDEYDTAFFDKRSKFLHYHARTLILNNLEYDHADIFPDLEAIKLQFQYLLRTVPADGAVIANADEEAVKDVLQRGCWAPVVYFSSVDGGVDAAWQWQAIAADGSHFRIYRDGQAVMEVHWGMIGLHHAANACAVVAAASVLGVALPLVKQALESFAGIRRRMTLVGTAAGVEVFDDFAHHPTAIAAVVEASRANLEQCRSHGRLWVIVEPRSNTMRTRIHQTRLASCFSAADRVLFMQPSERNLRKDMMLDVALLCNTIGSRAAFFSDVEAIVQAVLKEAEAGDRVLILSNGGFEGIHQRLLDQLSTRAKR